MPHFLAQDESEADLRFPQLDPAEHLSLASKSLEHCPPAQTTRGLSSEALAYTSHSVISPSFSHQALSRPPSEDVTKGQATHVPVRVTASPDAQPSMTSREGHSIWSGRDPLNGMSSPSGSSFSVGKGSYMPTSSLYAIWEPRSDHSDHSQGGSQGALPAPFPSYPAISTPLMTPTTSPIDTWEPEHRPQQSSLAVDENEGHGRGSSGPVHPVAGAGASADHRYASCRSRGGSDTNALLRELHVTQPPRTRRARLGTEATADAQPNSEGAKAEESRQLSR